MDSLTESLDASPRSLAEDAFFTPDRGAAVSRTVGVVSGKPPATTTTPTAFPGFKSRFTVGTERRLNPLAHHRMTKPAKDGGQVDQSLTGWKDEVVYWWVRSDSAQPLTTPPAEGAPAQPKLRVSIMFGAGSEMHRHGLAAVAARAAKPSLLILVKGVEESHRVVFVSPGNARRELVANSRWGRGINDGTVKDIVKAALGRDVPYDIVVLAAYSTGNTGLAGSITKRILDFSAVERVVFYDCLYGNMADPLALLASRNPTAKVIAYVCSTGGNSWQPGADKDNPGFDHLLLGGRSGWSYINLYFNTTYYAAASARVVNEGRAGPNPIITVLPADYTQALNGMIAALPPRLSLVSDAAVFKRIRGALPSGAVTLADAAGKHKADFDAFASKITKSRKIITNARLLGWESGGEDWHDLLLVEFAWEYLI